MEWTADIEAGDWIRERTDRPPRGTIHDIVPRGFAAYARVFHPVARDRPVGEPWPPEPWDTHRRAWEAFQKREPEVDSEQVTWATVAAAFGTRFHPLASWSAIVGQTDPTPGVSPRDAAGWRYGEPDVGQLDPGILSTLAGILSAHTRDPGDGFAAVWAGWGGLVGRMGFGPSRSLLSLVTAGDDAPRTRHDEFLSHAARDQFNDVFRKPTWQPGVLPDEVSRGPRLELGDRDFVLFAGGVAEFADRAWDQRMPWTDRAPLHDGMPASAGAPGIIWPADRSWILVTDVDEDSTIVGGPRDVVAAVTQSPDIEALQLPADAPLAAVGDRPRL